MLGDPKASHDLSVKYIQDGLILEPWHYSDACTWWYLYLRMTIIYGYSFWQFGFKTLLVYYYMYLRFVRGYGTGSTNSNVPYTKFSYLQKFKHQYPQKIVTLGMIIL